jgi:hypothetical protein
MKWGLCSTNSTAVSRERSLHEPVDRPAPGSISPEAQAILSMDPLSDSSYTAPEDTEAWRAYIAGNEEVLLAGVSLRGRAVLPAGTTSALISKPPVWIWFGEYEKRGVAIN